MRSQRQEVSNLLKRFVRGDIKDWEFDDFISTPNDDPLIEQFRIEVGQLPLICPAEDDSRYVSGEGIKRIIEISDDLLRSKTPDS